MTRHPVPVHALPVDAAGDHRPSASCPCRPILAVSITTPALTVYVHKHAPDARAADDRQVPLAVWSEPR